MFIYEEFLSNVEARNKGKEMKTNRKKSNIKLQEQEMSSPQRSTFRWNEDSNDTATQSLWI